MEATQQHDLAERVRHADAALRRAAADKVAAICDFAEAYRVDEDALLEILTDRRYRIGSAGTPDVSEFVCLELAGLLRCTPAAAGNQIIDALNLKHRHRPLFDAMLECRIEARRALHAADKCSQLTPDQAETVTMTWLPRQAGLGWVAAFNLLDKLIITADLDAAALREQKARESRGVFVWGLQDGVMNLTGCLDVLDARFLDASLNRMADVLAPQRPGLNRDQLRATALGVLAQPAQALALLQAAAQPELTDPGEDEEHGDPDGQHASDAGGHCAGRLCGTITTPLHKLRPTVTVAVHLHTDVLGQATGPARIDRAGWITRSLLAELLGDVQINVQPVIDLPNMPVEDGYVPSAGLSRALSYAVRHELFPYSNRGITGLDRDHTVPFQPGRKGQTRLGNLAPLSRRAHRAKTAGLWRSRQPTPDTLIWESPLGYRYEVGPNGTRQLE